MDRCFWPVGGWRRKRDGWRGRWVPRLCLTLLHFEPTLDRTVFTLDEAAFYIVVHFSAYYPLLYRAPVSARARCGYRHAPQYSHI